MNREGIYVIDSSTKDASKIIESIVMIHASCILVDKTLLTFLPPLSHQQIRDSWTRFLDQTVGDERQEHGYKQSRLIFVYVSKVSSRTPYPSTTGTGTGTGTGIDVDVEVGFDDLDPRYLVLKKHSHDQNSHSHSHNPSHPPPEGEGRRPAKKESTWSGSLEQVQDHHQEELVEISGVVSLFNPESQTGPFRGQVERLMVSPHHRNQGIAKKLMAELEKRALAMGRWNLTLDTSTGSPAELVYPRLGWQTLGIIKDYGISPEDGKTLVDETFFCKDLRTTR